MAGHIFQDFIPKSDYAYLLNHLSCRAKDSNTHQDISRRRDEREEEEGWNQSWSDQISRYLIRDMRPQIPRKKQMESIKRLVEKSRRAQKSVSFTTSSRHCLCCNGVIPAESQISNLVCALGNLPPKTDPIPTSFSQFSLGQFHWLQGKISISPGEQKSAGRICGAITELNLDTFL